MSAGNKAHLRQFNLVGSSSKQASLSRRWTRVREAEGPSAPNVQPAQAQVLEHRRQEGNDGVGISDVVEHAFNLVLSQRPRVVLPDNASSEDNAFKPDRWAECQRMRGNVRPVA